MKHHRAFFGLVLSLSLIAFPAAAQDEAAAEPTAESLIEKNLDAKGGKDKLEAVDSARLTGTMNMGGMEAPFVLEWKDPDKTRLEITIQGMTLVQAYDGETAWTLNPLAGVVEPTAISGPEAESIKAQAAFDSPFVDYETRGFEIALVGREVLGASAVYHLTLTSANGQVQHAYLDAATGLEVRIVTLTSSGRLEQELADYRNVEGVMKPHLIRLTANDRVVAEVRVTSIQFNVDLKDELFRR